MILDHREDRALVDAEVVTVEPARRPGRPSLPAALGPCVGNVALNASRKPYFVKRRSPYFSRIAISAGIVISGANGTDPPAAVGAMRAVVANLVPRGAARRSR